MKIRGENPVLVSRDYGKIAGTSIITLLLLLYSASPVDAEYQVNGDVVTDTQTGLIWMREDDGVLRNWIEALAYCENLDSSDSLSGEYSDWRLPDVNELQSLVKTDEYNPTIDGTAFPGCESYYYWSGSSGVEESANCAWSVDFNTGWTDIGYKTDTEYVRCVRGGP